MIDLHNAGPLIAEVRRLREEVAALKAEVARLAGVAREACDNLRHAGMCSTLDGSRCDCYVAALRASIPTPDPAAFVAAVDAFALSVERSSGWRDSERAAEALTDRHAARAALLALGGVR